MDIILILFPVELLLFDYKGHSDGSLVLIPQYIFANSIILIGKPHFYLDRIKRREASVAQGKASSSPLKAVTCNDCSVSQHLDCGTSERHCKTNKM